MQTAHIGSLEVANVGLGCMNLSQGYGAADDDDSARLLNRALDLGVTFLDTAMVYGDGHNERLVGRALGTRRREYTLATKCGLSRDGIDGDPRRIRGDCEASLARLGTDVIDLYYLHRVDPVVAIEETIGAMSRLVEAGLVRELGVSEVASDTLRRAHATHPLAALQSEYSLWSRTPEFGALDTCAELGIAFVPFSPLGRGFLADSARDVDGLEGDDLRATIARPRFEPAAFRANEARLAVLRDVARRLGRTPAQVALAWLVETGAREGGGEGGRGGARPAMIPIPGTRSIAHLEENAAAATVVLDGETRAALEAAFEESAIVGTRYTTERMASADAERDRAPAGA